MVSSTIDKNKLSFQPDRMVYWKLKNKINKCADRFYNFKINCSANTLYLVCFCCYCLVLSMVPLVVGRIPIVCNLHTIGTKMLTIQ